MDESQTSSATSKKSIQKSDLGWAAALTTLSTNLALSYSHSLPPDQRGFFTLLLSEANTPLLISLITVFVTWFFAVIRQFVGERYQRIRFKDKIEYLDSLIAFEKDDQELVYLKKQRSKLISEQAKFTVNN